MVPRFHDLIFGVAGDSQVVGDSSLAFQKKDEELIDCTKQSNRSTSEAGIRAGPADRLDGESPNASQGGLATLHLDPIDSEENAPAPEWKQLVGDLLYDPQASISRTISLIVSAAVTDSPAPAGPPRVAVVAFAITVLLGGANAVAVKQTVQELAPLWGAGLRFAAAGLLMVVIVLATSRRFGRGKTLRGAVLYGLLGFAASYGLLYTGIQHVPAGTVMVLVALTPLFTFGLALLHRQERFRIQGLLGALIALAGVAIVFVDQVLADVPVGSMLLILLGTVAIAESGVVAKSIPESDPFATNAVAMLTGAVVLFVLALVAREPLAVPATTATWLATGYLVVLGSVVMFALFLFTLQRWTASAVSYVTLLMPLVTVVLAAVAFEERISRSFVIGSAVVLVGVYIGAFFTRQPRHVPASSLPECLPVEHRTAVR